MSKQTAANFFILSPSEANSAGLYQVLLRGIDSYQQLGNRLVRLAEQAHAFRQFDKVKELALMLSNIPIKDFQAIGHYFLAVAMNCNGKGDQNEAKSLFELVLNTASDPYKVKAMLSLGALSFNRRDFDSATYFYHRGMKAGKLSAASLHAIRAISVLKAIEGDHAQAVKDLENILPLIKYAPAHIYFDILNSYAVELGEVGRIYEARNISQLVIHSPFAFAYPEWQDTANDLKGLNRSFVAFKPFKDIPRNVLSMPVREHEAEATQASKPARVMSLQKWKEKMVKDKTDEPELKDTRAILMWIMNTYTDDGTSDHERYRMYEAVSKIIAERNNPKPDDDDTGGA